MPIARTNLAGKDVTAPAASQTPPDKKRIEELLLAALRHAELAYSFVPNSYSFDTAGAIRAALRALR
jgi:hypothetical protein